MMTNTKNKIQNLHIVLYLALYSIFNLFTLTAFPFIHSDEAWLAGLTNEYIKHKTIFVSESFFDLMPRTVHTIKSFYHLLQMPFLALFGNTPFSVRLLSLLAAIITLYFFYRLLVTLKIPHIRALIYTILLSFNLQFIYAGHFGRQEMLLLMVLTISLYQYCNGSPLYKTGLLLGLSIGLHPNAFIITSMIVIIIFKDWVTKSISLKQLVNFIAIIGGFALLHIGVTLLANPHFLSEYWAYGKTLSVDALPASRLLNFKDFYLKLYYQISATYYIPPMKGFLLTGGLISMSAFIFGLAKKYSHENKLIQLLMDASLMVLAYNIAIFLIGRYNTTSITFLVLPVYLLLLLTMEVICRHRHQIEKGLPPRGFTGIFYGLLAMIVLVSLHSFATEYTVSARHNYDEYLADIHKHVDDDAIILGNLNSGFVFHDHVFYDIRNLTFINENSNAPADTTLEEYIKNRKIDTIIYYEEYDYIHRNKQWNILYGDDEVWYDDLQVFLKEKATLTHEFDNMYYGSRIIRFLGDYPWKVYIYRVK